MAMREYEVVHEIFNLCSGNQMRDVFIEEIEIPEGAFEEYIRSRHKEKELVLEREDLEDGTGSWGETKRAVTQKAKAGCF